MLDPSGLAIGHSTFNHLNRRYALFNLFLLGSVTLEHYDKMIPTFAIAALVSTLLVDALPCVQFDTSWNLYAFGGTTDVKLGQNTTWSSKSLSCLGHPRSAIDASS